jgi:hypothetical protein
MFKCIAFLIFLMLSSCSMSHPSPEATWISEPDFQYFEASRGFDISYDSGATRSIREYYTSGTVILNGSYFGWTVPGEYYPAWLWIDHTVEKYPLQLDDPNLSHVVAQCGQELRIIANITWQKSPCKESIFAFQAWPIIALNSINVYQFPAEYHIQKSWHTDEKHARTILWYDTDTHQIFFFVFTTSVSLQWAGEHILAHPAFHYRENLTLLNLDGWPSTAYYSGQWWFHSDKKLPIIFKIR